MRPTLKNKESGETVYKNIGAAGMLVAPIKSLAFDLRHQVFINTLRFTGFGNKMDTAIKTAVQKSFISAFSSVNTFLCSFEFDDAAPHRRQQTDLIEHGHRHFRSVSLPSPLFSFTWERQKKKAVWAARPVEIIFSMCRDYIVNALRY